MQYETLKQKFESLESWNHGMYSLFPNKTAVCKNGIRMQICTSSENCIVRGFLQLVAIGEKVS